MSTEGPGRQDELAVSLREGALLLVSVLTQAVGAAVTFVIVLLVLPAPAGVARGVVVSGGSLAALGAYLIACVVAGSAVLLRWARPVRRALRRGVVPPELRARAVRFPRLLLGLAGVAWAGGAVLFGVVNGARSASFGAEVAVTVVLAGAATSALAFVMTERLLRPFTALVLAGGPPEGVGPGVVTRSVLTWTLTTGGPVAAIVMVGAFGLALGVTGRRMALTAVVLGGLALAGGFLANAVSARSVGDPLRRLRAAMQRVARGELDVTVDVDDGTEVGHLQAGFNEMVAGLVERERLRDLYNRQVGPLVAEHSLARGPTLGGVECDVAVVFADIAGSTRLAQQLPPSEVVALLNGFFRTVVDVVADEGGWVNKFEGDAALCVFGAPEPLHDAPGAALRAARRLGDELAAAVPDVTAGVGVSAGRVVAGHVGAEDRFEYTVIGDPVNEAARISDLAKRRRVRVLATGRAVESAAADEAAQWRSRGQTILRGRRGRTDLAEPVE